MKNTKILAAAVIAALGFSACAKDGGERNEPKGSPAEVTINLKTPTTRADGGTEDGTGNEIAVTSLEFFVFDATGTPDSEGPYFKKTSALNEATNLAITSGNGKIFLVAANANIFADAAAYTAASAKNYTDIKAKIATLVLSNTNSQTTPGSGAFVMAGESTFNVQPAPASNNLTMTIARTLSKVEAPKEIAGGVDVSAVGNLEDLQAIFGSVAIPDQAAADAVTDLSWSLDGYVVINGISNSYIFQYEWADWTVPPGAAWFKTTYGGSDLIENVYAGNDGAADKFITATDGIVYIYENSPAKNTGEPGEATTFVKDQVTAFLIKGTFSATGQTSQTRYWRVNLIKDDVWKVYRNSIYRITLNSVMTPGDGTPEEAENGGNIVDPNEVVIAIDLNIAPWQIKLQGVDF